MRPIRLVVLLVLIGLPFIAVKAQSQVPAPQGAPSLEAKVTQLEGELRRLQAKESSSGTTSKDAMYWFKELIIPLLTPVGLLLAYVTYAVQKKLQVEEQDRGRYREATGQMVDYWVHCLGTDPRDGLFDVGGLIPHINRAARSEHLEDRVAQQDRFIYRQIHLSNLEESYLYYEHPESDFQLMARRVWIRAMGLYLANQEFREVFELNRGFYSSAFYRQMDILLALRDLVRQRMRQATDAGQQDQPNMDLLLDAFATSYVQRLGRTPERKPYPLLHRQELRGLYNWLFPSFALTRDGTWTSRWEDPVMFSLLRRTDLGTVSVPVLIRSILLSSGLGLVAPGAALYWLGGQAAVSVWVLLIGMAFLSFVVLWIWRHREAKQDVRELQEWLSEVGARSQLGNISSEDLITAIRKLDATGLTWQFRPGASPPTQADQP